MDRTAGAVYEIVLGARLDEDWSAWFEGFTVTSDGDTTVLCGAVVDQTELHGLLARVRDLGIPLVSVRERTAPSGNTPRGT